MKRGSNVDVELLTGFLSTIERCWEGSYAKCSIFYINNFQFSKLISKLKYNLNLPEIGEQLQITGSLHSHGRTLKDTLHSESNTMAILLHWANPVLDSSRD